MRVQFGEFELDNGSRLLRCGPDDLHLSPKAFQLLDLLVERRPNAIRKEELIDALWPDAHVEEANLKNLISEIRTTLEKSGGSPAWIRTVHRFGYAFAHTESESKARLMHGITDFPLATGENLIGRSSDCNLVIDRPGVSRHHARLRIANGAAAIEDAGSKNGTFVNDKQISGAADVRDGDRIRIGVVTFTFRNGQLSETTATIN